MAGEVTVTGLLGVIDGSAVVGIRGGRVGGDSKVENARWVGVAGDSVSTAKVGIRVGKGVSAGDWQATQNSSKIKGIMR